MFEQEKDLIRQAFDCFAVQHSLENAPFSYRDLPFSGEWGLSIPFFAIAAADKNRVGSVAQHAQFLAEAFVSFLSETPLSEVKTGKRLSKEAKHKISEAEKKRSCDA